MISVERLCVEFGGTTLFEDISFLIQPKEKIALVGKNGAGKTTLLRLLAGVQQPTRGIISYQKDITIGYLPQHMIHSDGTTLWQETEKAFGNIVLLRQQLEDIQQQLIDRTDYESPEYHSLLDKLSQLSEYLKIAGNGNYQAEMEKTLLGLGFLRSDFYRQCSEFSGGWRMRIELAKILLSRPNVLLLDEPTNHLDIESIQWLENFLLTSGSSVLLVSHDKAFIDAVTTRTLEISLGKLYDYDVNYSRYIQLLKERHEQQLRAYENQQKLIQDTEDFIERFRYKATKAIQVQSRIKQLEKLQRIEVDLEDNANMHLKFPPATHSGKIPLEIEHLSKAYKEHLVLDDVNLMIHRGEKVAFVGKNGEGKSTLVKCIMNEIEYSGTLKLGYNVKIGYFAQNQASLLDENLTVFDTVDRVAVGEIRTKIRDILGAFMFGGENSEKKVKVLSGGERSRLAMIKLLLEPVNFLILDEPTNHLDIPSKEVLKEAIKAFDGTAIIVSHDREFLDGLVTKVYEFGNKKVKEHLGGIYDFLQTKKIENLQELERNVSPEVKNEGEAKTESESKLNYESRKELNRKIRKLEKDVETTENLIADLDDRIQQMNMDLQIPEKASDPEFILSLQKKRAELERKMYEWEILSEELEKIRKEWQGQ
jgi:ATP-binding cassette subfamily F protein 3